MGCVISEQITGHDILAKVINRDNILLLITLLFYVRGAMIVKVCI